MKALRSNQDFYTCGGAMRSDAPSYIPRIADDQLFQGIQAGEFCYVLTSRQMGKTSLMVRSIERLRNCGWRVANIDLTEIGNRGQGQSDDAWYFTIVTKVAHKLEVNINLEQWWDERLRTTPIHRLMEFFRLLLATHDKTSIALFVDEIDCTIHLPFADDFFACIRACYNLRAQEPAFRRLSFTLLGSATPADLIQDDTRTPFNIGGRQIILEDFTLQQALPLTTGLPFDERISKKVFDRVFYWTNGHPYLTQRMLYEISTLEIGEKVEHTVDDVAFNIFVAPPLQRTERNIAEVKRYLISKEDWIEEIKNLYRLIRREDQRVDDDPLSPAVSYLKLSGLVKLAADGQLVVRNRIYELTFAEWEVGSTPHRMPIPRRAQKRKVKSQKAVHHTTAKIVLLGDSGVGKTGLGWRLAHGDFKEHAATHGQQFWVLNQLSTSREDGTHCEAILWDLAGQPDYRLIHSLSLDDADLALVLFDPTNTHDPLHGVEFWLNQLSQTKLTDNKTPCPSILVAARADRGEPPLTQDELDAFCSHWGISGGHLSVSALNGSGLEDLLRRMRALIPWDQKTASVTTTTFKRIKDYVLELKESTHRKKIIVSPQALRRRLEKTDKLWKFTDAEMMTAIGHLENYGYVRVLRTSGGEARILLVPELLNNLASTVVLEARRNPKGLGSLEEKRLLSGDYFSYELEKLSGEEQEILLDSVTLLFLKHNICFRETDPLSGQSYLVFPELINLKKPLLDEEFETEDGAAYTITGAIENIYASLVVLLGYTHTFTRTDQWRNQARYEIGDRLICGFRQEAERDGELDLILFFGTNVGRPVRALFQGLFESFLSRRNVNIFRFEPVVCANGHTIDRDIVRARMRAGSTFTYCPLCGTQVKLTRADEPIQLSEAERYKVEEQEWFAVQRGRFEQALFQIASYVEGKKLAHPDCFVSYAWGDKEQERWVERSLAADLQKAGINVLLDRWHNAQPGASVSRFVERIGNCDRIIVVGTPLYRRKYENKQLEAGYVVAAEVDLISNRLIGTEGQKETVIPVLLAGEKKSALPPLLHDRVFADFRDERAYFTTMFDLVLSLFGISPANPAVSDLRESLR